MPAKPHAHLKAQSTLTVIPQDDGWMDLFACGELLDDPPSLYWIVLFYRQYLSFRFLI
jgi:hypothetical protein